MTGWDGWMTSPTRWTGIWASSGNWWWTGKPGLLQSMGSQSQTRLSNWTELIANMAQGFLNGSIWPLKHSGVKHSNTCEVQNLCIIYSWLSVSEVSHPPIQPSLDWVVPQYIFLEKDLYVSGPMQFKPVIFKDQ